jgi:D-sedoheptulose 7-phosphate isomerase
MMHGKIRRPENQVQRPIEKFPSQRYVSAESYFDAYRKDIMRSWSTIDVAAVTGAAQLLRECLTRDGIVYACGNGGSAAIANHLLCDYHKGLQTGTDARPRVVSLSSHLELLTAIGNDLGYEDTFLFQLRAMARPGDLLLTISASGDSENVVRAALWAKQNAIPVISMVGFSGGRCKTIADVAIHVAAENYGVVEDVHQSVMHLLTQYLRHSMMPSDQIAASKF